MKMMIIDDDVQIREGIRDGIDWESMGISKVRSYGDGCEALADVEEFMPEIVLADIRMPEMDGLEFLKRIKQKNEQCLFGFFLLSEGHYPGSVWI